MKILYITMNRNRASTTVPLEGWFHCLPMRGLRPVLVTREVGPFAAWSREKGIPTYQDDLPFPDKRKPWEFVRSLLYLRRIVKRHQIQLVHCNEQDIYPIGSYLGRLCGLPVVVSIHFTMERNYCKWAFGGHRRPCRIIFVSKGNLDACRGAVEGIIPESDWRVLENGLDLDNYRPDPVRRKLFRRANGLSMDTPTIGVACALRPRKQLEHLVEVVCRSNHPDLRLVIAGGSVAGEELYAENLLADAKRKLGTRFLYLGHLEELRDLYNGLDLFVNTSQEEACSISVIESLACGLPVIGYPSKSVDGQILPGGGEIVEQDRVDLLTELLQRWLSNPRQLEHARGEARRRAEDLFDIRMLSDRLWGEYGTILSTKSRCTSIFTTSLEVQE